MGAGNIAFAPSFAVGFWSRDLHCSASGKATGDPAPVSCSESTVLWVCDASQPGSAPSPVHLEIWEALCMLFPCTSIKCPHAFQSYVPVMEAGSDVTFRWTVDDKPSFTFYNVVFNVIYQSPAVYKLSVSRNTIIPF